MSDIPPDLPIFGECDPDDSNQTDKRVPHPLEDVFGIEEESTMIPHSGYNAPALVKPNDYDDKDHEIDNQFQDVYDYAIEQFETIHDSIHALEGKFRARNHEAATAYLGLALQAAKEKQNLKNNKDNIKIKTTGNTGGQSGIQVQMSHSEMLQLLRTATEKPVAEQTEASDITEGEIITEDIIQDEH